MSEIISSGNGVVVITLQWKRYELAAVGIDDLLAVEEHLRGLQITGVIQVCREAQMNVDALGVVMGAMRQQPTVADALQYLCSMSGARFMIERAFGKAYPKMNVDEVFALFEDGWNFPAKLMAALLGAPGNGPKDEAKARK